MTTLQQVINSVKDIKIPKINISNSNKNFANKFLGKFKKILPEGKTSTEYIRELRDTLYGKIK